MNTNFILTLLLLLMLIFSNTGSLPRSKRLGQFQLRSKMKFIFYLFISNIKRDYLLIFMAVIVLAFAQITILEKSLLSIFYIVSQLTIRTYQYFDLQSAILINALPLFLAGLFDSKMLLVLVSATSSFSIVLAPINSVHKPSPLHPNKDPSKYSKILILLCSTLLGIIIAYSPLNKIISFTQVLPLLTLVFTVNIEKEVSGNNDYTLRHRSYFSLYRLRSGKVSLKILGYSVSSKLKNLFTAYLPLVFIFTLNSTSILEPIALILSITLTLYSSFDLLLYNNLTGKSIVYSNTVTRFLVTQIPSFIIFTYILVTTIESHLVDYNNFISKQTFSMGFIVLTGLMCWIYHSRLRKIVKI